MNGNVHVRFQEGKEGQPSDPFDRDYSSVVDTYIRVYPDRVEISNPGNLPVGWTKENLFRSHDSKPANPTIAQVFFAMRYIEKYGSGIGTIRKECAKMGLPEPEYNVEKKRVEIIFRLPPKKPVKGGIGGPRMTETELKVFELICEGKEFTADEMSKAAGVSAVTVKRAVAGLTKKGYVEREGSNKDGRWIPKLRP